MKKIISVTLAASLLIFTGCTNKKEMELEKIIQQMEEQVIPLRTVAAEASWDGSITGNPEDFQRYSEASMKMTEIFSNKEVFNQLKEIKESGKVEDPILKRELDVLYDTYLGNQADTALLNLIIEKESAFEMK